MSEVDHIHERFRPQEPLGDSRWGHGEGLGTHRQNELQCTASGRTVVQALDPYQDVCILVYEHDGLLKAPGAALDAAHEPCC